MGTAAHRRCPTCGGELPAWTERCTDCDERRARPQRRTSGPSRARADRKLVTPGPPSRTVAPSPYAGAWRRGLARCIDAWIIAITYAISTTVLTPIPYLSWIVLVALVASFESLSGRTPGKAAAGVRVEGGAGGPPSLPTALVRNAWQLLALVPVLGPWLLLGAQLGIGWQIARQRMHRGPHDLVAGTVVVCDREPLGRRLIAAERAKAARDR